MAPPGRPVPPALRDLAQDQLRQTSLVSPQGFFFEWIYMIKSFTELLPLCSVLFCSVSFIKTRREICGSSTKNHIVKSQYGHSQSSLATANLNKSEEFVTNTTAASNYIPRRPRISINWNPPFQTSLHKISKVVFFWLKIIFFRNKKKIQGTTFVRFFNLL